MTPVGGRLSDDVLRETVRQAVSRTSLREVARAMDAWPSALAKFLNGARPRESTRRRLLEWYTREAGSIPHLSPEAALAGLDLLVEGLAGSQRAAARERILSVIEAAHREQRTEPPPWIALLRAPRESPES